MAEDIEHECAFADGAIGRKIPCAGPWWVERDYFFKAPTGKRDLYSCEAHAKQMLRAGSGARLRPVGGAR